MSTCYTIWIGTNNDFALESCTLIEQERIAWPAENAESRSLLSQQHLKSLTPRQEHLYPQVFACEHYA